MKKVLVVVHDKKSRTYGSPIMYDTVDAAVRECHRAVTTGRSIKDGQKPLIAMYPEDFELVHVADYDSERGVIIPLDGFVYMAVDEIVKE